MDELPKRSISPFGLYSPVSTSDGENRHWPPYLPTTLTEDLSLKIGLARAQLKGTDKEWDWTSTCAGHGVRFLFKEGFGSGSSELIELEEGVYARLRRSIHSTSYGVWSRHDGEINFTVILKGGVGSRTEHGPIRWIWGPTAFAFFEPQAVKHFSEVAEGVPVHMVSIWFRNVQALARFGLIAGRQSTTFLTHLIGQTRKMGVTTFKPSAEVASIAEAMLTVEMEGVARQLFFGAKARELICYLIQCQTREEFERGPSLRSALGTRNLAQLVRSRIDLTLSEPLSGDDLAREFGVSRNTLMRHFKSTFRITMYEYCLSKKMERATHLLETTLLPITDIALSVGYSTPSSFTDAFRRHFGKSPSQFRTNLPH